MGRIAVAAGKVRPKAAAVSRPLRAAEVRLRRKHDLTLSF
jgi:hypothetical protein